ncbi:phosphogluconate dehydratase [Arenicella xantha]|uniref:Phosphogluconate dehydratase n=1 Tax=Arenicella xantha TaxID=644221 RepID=A0A395JJ01_9GAMM|nr:phosphogluconate dehydratase [Arenicella xantha]RBP49749.1 6-phosphogluconate dehydratase [Arenicella xantha]
MTIKQITDKIIERSKASRAEYLAMVDEMRNAPPAPDRLSCSNWAHVVAAESEADKKSMPAGQGANIGIVTAYNDMLSAHQPFANYPNVIKLTARDMGATAQVAGGVPAMCDGVTQGQPGMELSLFSRDVIALATAVSLSHDVYDGIMCLGVCDKIVPGLVIGALQFGHLPAMFVPAGPMPSGIPNKEKALARQKFATGEIDKAKLLESESASYHSAGTCTFYGTANTNQTLMEALGLQLAGTSFVNPGTALRTELTKESVRRLLDQTGKGSNYRPLAEVVTEKSIVNAMVMMMATGGSTNLTLHLIAMAAAAGIQINWHDMDEISRITPLLARVYPNGQADVNHFERAGGLAFLVNQLRSNGLLNEDVVNVMGEGLDAYARKPALNDQGSIEWGNTVTENGDATILSTVEEPFAAEGGMRTVTGNIGTGVVKISAVDEQYQVIEAPCKIFETQEALKNAFDAGELASDHIAVVRFQGPSANGMPELHKLTPYLGILQDRGFKVALVTDGRMSGASGKVLTAMHVSPEAKNGGLLAYLREGDVIRVNCHTGELQALVEESVLSAREPAAEPVTPNTLGRGLFEKMRAVVGDSTHGASFIGK